tara:strand:- start:2757 stop:3473 length:717 start_codon:yes stop_codon:yes gene_type:complete
MKAIILAAGLGSRLGKHTKNISKCLLTLHGKPIIYHQLDILSACGVDDVFIVTGYKGEQIEKTVGSRAKYYHYPDFALTNNLHTVNYCNHLIQDDILIIFSDVLVSYETMRNCVENVSDIALLIDTDQNLPNTMRIRQKNGEIYDIGNHIQPSTGDGNFIGIAKFSIKGSKLLRENIEEITYGDKHKTDYYTIVLPVIAAKGHTINIIPVNNNPWIEIDHIKEFEQACKMDFYLLSRN